MLLSKGIKRGAAALAVAGVVAAGSALPAQANLIGYDNTNFGSQLYNVATAPYIDVVDNRTSSLKNQTSRPFSARNVSGLFSFEAMYVNANGLYNTLSANNQIDHFDRR